jgi:quercetin dioxygenase-like cupin family protein
MAGLEAKALDRPDDVRPFEDGKGSVRVVSLSSGDVGYGTFEPGWRWSQHVKPKAGTDSCQVEHVGYVLKGRMKVVMDDGSELEVGAGDAFRMQPGHDAWIVGEEPCELVDFGGLRGYAQAG